MLEKVNCTHISSRGKCQLLLEKLRKKELDEFKENMKWIESHKSELGIDSSGTCYAMDEDNPETACPFYDNVEADFTTAEAEYYYFVVYLVGKGRHYNEARNNALKLKINPSDLVLINVESEK